MADSLADNLSLEAKAQDWGEQCARFANEHGVESPDLLFEYGKAVFAVAKRTASLVDTNKVEEKQMPLENPKVKLAAAESDTEETDEAASGSPGDGSVADASTAAEQDADSDSETEDDFVFAFQIVDSCRVLYRKQRQTTEVKGKLAKTHELLGDISLEDDNAPQAIEDFTAASALNLEIYGATSGEYSGTEFMLSIAYDTIGEPEKSLEHLKLAADAAKTAKLSVAPDLEMRVSDLEQELRIAAKIGDKNTKAAEAATKESISGRSAIKTAVQGLVSGANDISQLTRKRKRPDSKTPEPEPEPKPEARK